MSRDALIDGNKNLKARNFSCPHELSVFEPSQSGETGGLAIMVREKKTQAFVNAFVDENTLEVRQQELLRFFERFYCGSPVDGWKSFQEVF